MKVDILAMELQQGLPHWLTPEVRNAGHTEAIRKKHRDAHFAAKKAAKIAGDDYDPNEPRKGKGEGGGQWTAGGSNPSSPGPASGINVSPAAQSASAFSAATTEAKRVNSIRGVSPLGPDDPELQDQLNQLDDDYSDYMLSKKTYEPPDAAGQIFASPNMKTLQFSNANAELKGPRQKLMSSAFHAISQTLGIKSDQYDALGAWRDGAENSIMSDIGPTSFTNLVAAGAMMGALAHQKSVLVFQTGHGGGTNDFMAHFCAEGDLPVIHQKLLDMGLEFHTLIPHEGRVHVYVFGNNDKIKQAVNDAGKAYGSKTEIQFGKGEFIGSEKGDDTPDDAVREDAQRAYNGIIQWYISKSGQSGGHNVGTGWARLRDRWSAIGRPPKNVSGKFAKSFGDKDAKAKLFQWQTSGNDKMTDIEQVVRSGIENQKHFAAVGAEIAKALKGRVVFKNPGAKVWDKKTGAVKPSGVNRVLEKAKTRGLGGITDVARLGYTITSPEDRDVILAGLRKHFNVIDEGYQRNEWGYYDAKALVQFDDGMIGEVQIMEKNLADLKGDKGDGHKIYVANRELPEGPQREAAMKQSQQIYRGSLKTAHPSWKSIYDAIPFRPG